MFRGVGLDGAALAILRRDGTAQPSGRSRRSAQSRSVSHCAQRCSARHSRGGPLFRAQRAGELGDGAIERGEVAEIALGGCAGGSAVAMDPRARLVGEAVDGDFADEGIDVELEAAGVVFGGAFLFDRVRGFAGEVAVGPALADFADRGVEVDARGLGGAGDSHDCGTFNHP